MHPRMLPTLFRQVQNEQFVKIKPLRNHEYIYRKYDIFELKLLKIIEKHRTHIGIFLGLTYLFNNLIKFFIKNNWQIKIITHWLEPNPSAYISIQFDTVRIATPKLWSYTLNFTHLLSNIFVCTYPPLKQKEILNRVRTRKKNYIISSFLILVNLTYFYTNTNLEFKLQRSWEQACHLFLNIF